MSKKGYIRESNALQTDKVDTLCLYYRQAHAPDLNLET